MLQLSRVRVTAKSSLASSTSGRYQLAEPVCVCACVCVCVCVCICEQRDGGRAKKCANVGE